MNRPWEVMMNFQKRLRPAASSGDGNGDRTTQLSAAAQRFLPSNNIVTSRALKVQNIINESARIIEESRPPDFNSTAVSFCRNCACDNCMNQSVLNETQLNQTNVNNLVQNFQKFLDAQKQQFMAMIQQVASLDTTVGNIQTVQQTECNMFTSSTTSTTNKLPAITECDSSVVQKSMEAVTSNDVGSRRIGAPMVKRVNAALPSTSSPQCDSQTSSLEEMNELSDSTVVAQEDECCDDTVMEAATCSKDKISTVTATSNNHDEKLKPRLSSGNDSDAQNSLKSDETSEFESFDDFIDDSFRPVRRSSQLRLRDSFVMLENIKINQTQADNINPVKPVGTDTVSKKKPPKSSKFKIPAIPVIRKNNVEPTESVKPGRSNTVPKNEPPKSSNFKIPPIPVIRKKNVEPTESVPPNRANAVGKKETPKSSNLKFPFPDTPKNDVQPTACEPRTRSGRAVKKPQNYWETNHRADDEEEDPPKRRGINRKNNSKQIVPNNSKRNHLKTVSLEDDSIAELPPTSSGKEILSIVSSSSDCSGAKRGRKEKNESISDSSHATKDASKHISAKRRKMESQTIEKPPTGSKKNPVSKAVVKAQPKASKRQTKRSAQNENASAESINTKNATKGRRPKKQIANATKENSTIRTEQEKQKAILQVQMKNLRYPSLSGDLSFSIEPQYECFVNGELSD